MHYLYKITNTINGKIYIGQTANMNERWRQHKYFAKNPEKTGQYIHRAMNKYGFDNFIYEELAVCQIQNDANETEIILIKQYDSRNPLIGYNLLPGGGGLGSGPDNPNYGKKQSPEVIEKRIAARAWYQPTEEHKEKVRHSLLGKKHSDERRANQSKAHIGQESWNKGTKGIMKPNSTSFSADKPAPNKGRKRIVDEFGRTRFIKVNNEQIS